MNELAILVGQRIRSYRTSLGYSQERLAEMASCHPTYIGQIERGEKNATLESIEKITCALCISISKLLENIDSNEKGEKIDYPLMCYELLLSKSIKEQEHIYNILSSIDAYKNN